MRRGANNCSPGGRNAPPHGARRGVQAVPKRSIVMSRIPALTDFGRIVIKVGSSLLVDSAAGAVREAWLNALVDDIAGLHKGQRDILVVSSGAIALGRSILKLPRGP